MIAVIVRPGDTLSSIAEAHGESLWTVERDNPQITDPNRIYAGESVNVGGYAVPGSSSNPASPSAVPASNALPAESAPSGGGLSDVPGVPQSFAACVAYRESTDLQNPAAHGNAYGIIPASGYDVAGDSLAQQKAVFRQIYQTAGPSAWAADGCPGT